MGCSASRPALPVALQPTKPVRKPHEAPTPVFAVDDKSPVKITIRILQARNLLAKDASGTSDPYAEVSFGQQRFRSDIVSTNCNPVWKQAEFHIDPYFAHEVNSKRGDAVFSERFLRIELYDDDQLEISGESGEERKKRKKADMDGTDDFLGRVDLACPLWEHESQKWYLLRQRSKRSRVAGEVEIYIKVEIRANPRNAALGPPPFAKLAVKGRQPLRPYPSSSLQGQDIIVRAKIFNEYFALPQYYCEIRPDALIIRLDSQLAPVFVILKCLVTSSSIAQDNKEEHVVVDIHLRGYANKITIQAPKSTYALMDKFIQEARDLPVSFPKRTLKCVPEYYGCGKEYFSALYDALLLAKESIFIAGWMFTPEIYLKRDEFPWNSSHRLESILKTKAEEGVKVFVLIYNDRDVAGVNAAHVVDALEQRHANIHIGMHGPAQTKDIYWSHHSKLVVIDWDVCFVGGMDLCVGRYDTPDHPVVDVELPYTFLGADYYNPRVRHLERLDKPFTERFDRHYEARLPWQDIAAKYGGQIARDCGMYFIHRWTFSLLGLGFKMKQGKRAWILPPIWADDLTTTVGAGLAAAAGASEETSESEQMSAPPKHFAESAEMAATTTVQLLRSFPKWAGFTPRGDVTDEDSIYVTMLQQIESAQRFIYIENQFFISSATEKILDGHIKMRDVVGAPCVQLGGKISRGPRNAVSGIQAKLFYEHKQFMAKKRRKDDDNEFGELQAHMDERKIGFREDVLNLDDDDEEAYQTMPSLPKRMAAAVGKPHMPHRKSSNWKMINVANKITLALFNRVSKAITNKEEFCIGIVLPDFPEGHYAKEPYTRLVMHFQQHTLCRGPNSLFGRLESTHPGVDLSQYIQFFALRSFGFVGHFPMQEGIYVHSKLMICDDTACMVGSANVNDRSLLGSRDSETGILLETTTSAVRDFRRKLWSRHLGVDESDAALDDPVQCLRELWRPRAKANSRVYESVWPQSPNNLYTKFSDIPAGRAGPYFTVGQLDEIKGKVTEYPMRFLSEETLTGFDKEGVFVDDVMFT